MKNLIFLALLLSGCQSLSRILPQYKDDTPPQALPAVFIKSGVTVTNHDLYAPFRTIDSDITVKIKRGTDWYTLNKYEVAISTKGTGSIEFRNSCIATYSENGTLLRLVFTGLPVAPQGTPFEITDSLR